MLTRPRPYYQRYAFHQIRYRTFNPSSCGRDETSCAVRRPYNPGEAHHYGDDPNATDRPAGVYHPSHTETVRVHPADSDKAVCVDHSNTDRPAGDHPANTDKADSVHPADYDEKSTSNDRTTSDDPVDTDKIPVKFRESGLFARITVSTASSQSAAFDKYLPVCRIHGDSLV